MDYQDQLFTFITAKKLGLIGRMPVNLDPERDGREKVVTEFTLNVTDELAVNLLAEETGLALTANKIKKSIKMFEGMTAPYPSYQKPAKRGRPAGKKRRTKAEIKARANARGDALNRAKKGIGHLPTLVPKTPSFKRRKPQ